MPVYSSVKNPYEIQGVQNIPMNGIDTKKLQALGYDGVMYRDEAGVLQEVVAFQPTQVKSATGNKGTYDMTKPDINEAKGGLVRMAEGGSSNYHPDVQDALKAGRITPNQAKWMSNYARTAGNPEIGTAGIPDGISEKMMNYRNAVRAGEHTRPSWMEPIPKEVKIPYWATGKLDLDREGLRQLDKIPAMTKKAFNASEYSNTYPAGANDLNYYNELVKASQEAPDYQPYIDEINKIKERNPSIGKAKGGAIRMQVGGLSKLAQ